MLAQEMLCPHLHYLSSVVLVCLCFFSFSHEVHYVKFCKLGPETLNIHAICQLCTGTRWMVLCVCVAHHGESSSCLCSVLLTSVIDYL